MSPATKKVSTDRPAEAAETKQSWRNWFSNTSIYGFELFMAAFGVLTAAFVVDYGIASLFRYLYMTTTDKYYSAVDSFPLWVVAAMLVWVTLALTFYLRARSELDRNEARRQTNVHKVITSIFSFVTIVALAVATFTALYSLMKIVVGISDDAARETVVVAIPALLIAGLHLWLLQAFRRPERSRKKTFVLLFAGLTASIMIVLLIVTVGDMRAEFSDQKKENDLSTLQTAVKDYYRDNSRLPGSINDLDIDEDEDLKLDSDNYTYVRKTSSRYELCADFSRDTKKQRPGYYEPDGKDDYQYQGYFSYHEKGQHCFKLRASYRTDTPSYKFDD